MEHLNVLKYKAIIFDAGGVILYPNFDWIISQLASVNIQSTYEQLYRSYYQTIYEVDLEINPPSLGVALSNLDIRIWFFSRLMFHLNIHSMEYSVLGKQIAENALREFPRESDIYHWAMPGVQEALRQLKTNGFSLGVASNNDGALFAQLQSVHVADVFSALCDSGIEHVQKPDPELLFRAAHKLHVSVNECLFVGDVDRIDGQAARNANMDYVIVDPFKHPRKNHPRYISFLSDLLNNGLD